MSFQKAFAERDGIATLAVLGRLVLPVLFTEGAMQDFLYLVTIESRFLQVGLCNSRLTYQLQTMYLSCIVHHGPGWIPVLKIQQICSLNTNACSCVNMWLPQKDSLRVAVEGGE